MRSNYKRICDFIEQVKIKNVESKYDLLLGINIDKFFMPSVANVVGTDLSRYKIVKPNQFACNRMHVGRDYRIPIALSQLDHSFIVSPAYDVFKIKDTNILLPEYLMMWFSRKEFDRNAWFHTDADVRGGLPWKAFCDIELPIPSIEKQKEIVAEYNTVTNRIKLNEQLNQKLEETAQSIYKHWFVDFEFPDENGKPYKSSGGKMVFNEELDKEIPEGWEVLNIEKVIPVKDGTHDSPKPQLKGHPLITSTHLKGYDLKISDAYYISKVDFEEINRRSKVEKYDILFSMIGTVGLINFVLYDEINFAIKNVGLFKSSEKVCLSEYILFYLKSSYTDDYFHGSLSGSTQSYITLTALREIPFLMPENEIVTLFKNKIKVIVENIHKKTIENQKLIKLQSLLLSKMSKVIA
jgi:type I restriction enzyme S subunit